jgi:HEAT repeat protein
MHSSPDDASGLQRSSTIAADIRRLSSTSRRTFVPALGRLEKQGLIAVPDLIEATTSDHLLVRCRAAMLLGKTHSELAYDVLAGLLNDPAHEVQYDSMVAMGYLGDARCIPSLISILERDDDEHGLSCAAGLGLSRLGSAAVPALLEIAKHGPTAGRARAMRAISNTGQVDASESIAEFLRDQEVDVRIAAIEALTTMRPHDVCARLKASMLDPDPKVAETARYCREELKCGEVE